MRIGIDVSCWHNPRGYGRVTRRLVSAMVAAGGEHEFVLFTDDDALPPERVAGPSVQPVVVPQSVPPTEAAVSDGSRSPFDMLRFTRAVRRARPDVFFSPSVYTYFPLPPRLPAVVMIHDAIPERLPELTLPSRRARIFWNAKVRLALWQARVVLTVSEFSRRELVDVFGLEHDVIHVATNAPSSAFRPSESPDEIAREAGAVGLPDGADWFVYVGGFNPHKHVDKIVRAHARLARSCERPPHVLLVGKTGGAGWHGNRAAIQAAIDEEGTQDLVHWTGFVPDERLRHLFTGALASLLPSELEGFGLPPIEAAACGAPCIATTASPLPELLAGGGFFVPPGDVDELERGMRRLVAARGLRDELGQVARQRAAELTWERSAASALAAVEAAVGKRQA
jgi:alpha-1,3-rhamnosyl/mannosyltransferase